MRTLDGETITVTPVTNDADAKAWVDVPFRLYADNAAWVPPLRSEMLRDMDWQTNPFHRHAHTQHFLLREGGIVRGRVAAIVHPAYNDRHDRQDVFFGFLDAPVHPNYLEPLLRACEDFGRRYSATVLSGPYNYWSGAEFGLLTNDFDRPTALLQPWNPAGMKEVLEGLGFTSRTHLDAFEIDMMDLAPVRENLLKSGHRVSDSTGIRTRPFRVKKWREDGEIIRRLNSESFAASSEVLPYPPDVFDHMLKQLKPLLDPSLVRIAARGDEPVGFSLTLPDANQLMHSWGGSITVWDLLRLRAHKKRVDGAVVLLLGVRPNTPMGVAHLLFADTLKALESGGYKRVHTTWVHEENVIMRTLLGDALSIPSTRRWAVMCRDLV